MNGARRLGMSETILWNRCWWKQKLINEFFLFISGPRSSQTWETWRRCFLSKDILELCWQKNFKIFNLEIKLFLVCFFSVLRSWNIWKQFCNFFGWEPKVGVEVDKHREGEDRQSDKKISNITSKANQLKHLNCRSVLVSREYSIFWLYFCLPESFFITFFACFSRRLGVEEYFSLEL